ncbi:hypothetical protein GCM10023310_55670 [Paenibacillus vulneris]|uniref:YmiA family membrane protein n=1 Tax=Paenibacillus vulneris TaxID=1133364 RepID=A0ABW3UWB9_9BACL|nr:MULTISPECIES: hypothetical protein [unclassified Paenibacillus]MBE1446198.1 hypothetical protein [Paenibacillus sp. OAS669]
MDTRLLQDKTNRRFDWRWASVCGMMGFLAAVVLWIAIIWFAQQ